MAKVVTARARFQGDADEETKKKGLYTTIFYTIRIKQIGETFRIKRADDFDNISVTDYPDLETFLTQWQINMLIL